MPLLPAPKSTAPTPGIVDPLTALVNGTPVQKKQAAAKKKAAAPQAPYLPGKAPDQQVDMSTQPEPIPTEPLPQSGPPIPVLQRYGVNMSISDVNAHVDALTAAHLKAFGYSPTPGMVFDVLKAQGVTGPVNYDDLFGIPTSKRDAQAMIVARQGSGDTIATLPVVTPKSPPLDTLVKGMLTAYHQDSSRGNFAGNAAQDAWSSAYGGFVKQALEDPTKAGYLTGALLKAGVPSPGAFLQSVAQGDFGLGILSKALEQITYSTTDMPYGFYRIAKAAGMDTFDLSTIPMHSLAASVGQGGIVRARPVGQATHLANIGKQMGESMWEDVNHPTDRPGYLVMDIWGALTFGAGAIGKVAAAGDALKAGDIAGAGKALITKAKPAASTMGIPGYQASLPLSDTTIVRVLQQHFPGIGRNARQDRLLADQTDGLVPDSMREHVNAIFGTEKSIARARARDAQIHYALALTPVVEMTRLSRWDSIARSFMQRSEWKNLLQGKPRTDVQKAMQLLFTDDPDPVGTWTAFHQSQIDSLTNDSAALADTLEGYDLERAQRTYNYSIAAHKGQLDAIELAQGIIRNPPKRFVPLLKAAYEVAGDAQAMKELTLGLDPEIADQAIARMGAQARQEPIIPLGKDENNLPRQGVLPEGTSIERFNALTEQETRLQARLDNTRSRLNTEEKINRLHPGSNAKALDDAQRAYDRHSKSLGNVQRKLEEIKASATPLTRKVTPETNAGFFDGGAAAGADADVAELREAAGGGSAYFPTHPEKYRGSKSALNRFRIESRFGLKKNKYLFKANTGEALQLGDFRWDMTNLLAENFKTAYQAATRRTQWQDLWNASVKDRISEQHAPIRDIEQVPDELREVVQALEREKMDKKFTAIVDESKMEALQNFLYPDEETLAKLDPKHVRWVDQRLILNKVGGKDTGFWNVAGHMLDWKAVDAGMNKIMAPINEPMRTLLIFATPAYALNALGSAALLLVQDGFLAPLELGRSMAARHIYGPEVTRILDRLAGQTHASSLVTETNWMTKGSQGLANAWQTVTDLHFRRAAVIHELRRAGLLREHMTNDELKDFLQHEDNAQAVNQAAQTARKAMLDFNSISWPEKAVLRHLFFVYSFVRSSAVWSLRYLRDHGIQSDVLAHAGESRQQNIDNLIGKMPDWFMKAGYFAVNPDTIYNPIQWNMPGMLEQTSTPLTALFGNTPYSTPAELLGPAAQFGYEALTGNDMTGKALPSPGGIEGHIPGSQGTVGKSFMALWNQIGIGGGLDTKAQKAAKEKQNPIPPPSVSSGALSPIKAARAQERAGLNEPVLSVDGWWNTTGAAIFRSGIPRDVNPIAGEARYWRDLRATDPAAYHQHELDLVHQMVSRQQKVLGEPVTPEVLSAVDMISHVSQSIEDYQVAHKGEHPLNRKQTNVITLDSLVAQGRIKDKAKWMKEIDNAQDKDQKGVQTLMLLQAGGKAWFNWVQRVNEVDGYAQPKYISGVQTLRAMGMGDYSESAKQPREARWAYGRQAEQILQQAKQLKAAVSADTSYEADIARQKWVEFVNENDAPIKVKGVTYPSPFAYQLASETAGARSKAIASFVKKNPRGLTAMQEELLTGKRTDPIVARARTTLFEALQEQQQKLGFGKTLPPGMKAFYQDAIAKQVPAYAKALAFEQEPLADRMKTYIPIQKSPNADAWDWLLRQASSFHAQAAKVYVDSNGKPRQSLITKAWATQVPIITETIKKSFGKSFLSELSSYTGTHDAQHADAFLDKFLVRLVNP